MFEITFFYENRYEIYIFLKKKERNFRKNVNFLPIFLKSVNFEHFVIGIWTHYKDPSTYNFVVKFLKINRPHCNWLRKMSMENLSLWDVNGFSLTLDQVVSDRGWYESGNEDRVQAAVDEGVSDHTKLVGKYVRGNSKGFSTILKNILKKHPDVDVLKVKQVLLKTLEDLKASKAKN